MRNNAREVNKHLCAMPVCFCEAMEDGVRHVDVREVVEGLPWNTNNTNMVLLMPQLEEATNIVLRIASLARSSTVPRRNAKGDGRALCLPAHACERRRMNQHVFYG